MVLGVEAKVGVGHNMFDEGQTASANIAGKDVMNTTVEAGVEGRIGLISGQGSIEGTGVLKAIKF